MRAQSEQPSIASESSILLHSLMQGSPARDIWAEVAQIVAGHTHRHKFYVAEDSYACLRTLPASLVQRCGDW